MTRNSYKILAGRYLAKLPYGRPRNNPKSDEITY